MERNYVSYIELFRRVWGGENEPKPGRKASQSMKVFQKENKNVTIVIKFVSDKTIGVLEGTYRLSQAQKNVFVKAHNDGRSKVANRQESRGQGNNGGAANMMKMVNKRNQIKLEHELRKLISRLFRIPRLRLGPFSAGMMN